MLAPPSDAELMASVRSGDRDAFAALVDRYKDAMVNYLTRMTGCRDRAEDLAQETFLRLYQSAHRYQERGKLLPLLYRIATNLVRSEARRATRARLFANLFAWSTNGHAEPAAQKRLLDQELNQQLAAAVADLPLTYRAPLVLCDIEGWSYRDIARWLGCREGTVKSRIHRGRQRLKEVLTPYWNEGVPS